MWSETMSEQTGRAFYNARGARALELASQTKDPEMAAIHHRTAKSYFELAELTPEDNPNELSNDSSMGQRK
jgi:hypothetical protein